MHKFQKGERVRWSQEGARRCRPRTDPNRVGTIKSQPKTSDCYNVLWDGRKKIESIHQDFLEKVVGDA